MDSSKQPWQLPAVQELAVRLTAGHAKGRFIDSIYGQWSVRDCSPPAPASEAVSRSEPDRHGRQVGRAIDLSHGSPGAAARAWQAPAVQELTIGGP
jgi:hypothetical protein